MEKTGKNIISNRRAFYEFEILEEFEAGLVLQGTEIKSLRQGGGSLQEAYVKVVRQDVVLIGCSIPPYKFGNFYNHQEKRERKLLLHKREIAQLKRATQEKGLTVVPLSLYINKEGIAKLKIALARGKNMIDKRQSIKEADDKRKMQKILKDFR